MSSGLATIAVFVLGSLLTVISGLLVFIFKELRRQIRTNGRHLDSVMQVLWGVLWRTDHIEDWLDQTSAFKPLQRTPDWPFHK